ncbi:MAG: serine hydrolase [Myxococcales bacterium]|nr:serine hydrolase [Myxococcales bacterium]MCB9533670.1 serine hydrolase [Myxococcales bacterium]
MSAARARVTASRVRAGWLHAGLIARATVLFAGAAAVACLGSPRPVVTPPGAPGDAPAAAATTDAVVVRPGEAATQDEAEGPGAAAMPTTMPEASATEPETEAVDPATPAVAGSTTVAPPPAGPTCGAMDADDAWVARLLERDPVLAAAARDAASLRLQVVVGEVARRDDGTACVTYHPYRLDAEYLYPASAIKTFAALAAVRTLDALRSDDGVAADLGLDTELRFERATVPDVVDLRGRPVVLGETTATLRELLDQTLILSSNDGFNRLLDFAGLDAINGGAERAGFTSVRVSHRLSRQLDPPEATRWSPPVSALIGDAWRELEPARASSAVPGLGELVGLEVGTAYIDPVDGGRRDAPLGFADKNSASIFDLLRLVAWVADPALTPELELSDVSDESRLAMRAPMATVPDESDRYEPLSPGVTDLVPWERLEYVNKAGRAFGFHLDAAYLRDRSTGRELLVAAGMFVDTDGVMNDDTYAYDSLSYPFFVALGRVLAERVLVVDGGP